MGEKKRDKEYTRVKNIHLVENNHIYSFEELQELLGYKTINPIIYFVEKKNLQTIDNNHIWGRKLREFDKELKANKPKALDNQLWCPSCQSPKDVENNEITIKIDYNVRYKSGHNKLQIYAKCADCGANMTPYSCTSKLPKLEKNFKINYMN